MAPRKGFSLEVILDIHAVTCPGVWLCTNGEVSMQVFLFNSTVQTAYVRPSFPMNFQERYVFNEVFYSGHSLSNLEKVLSKELLYIELIQWDNNFENGDVLASFQTSLNELLYPSIQKGVNVGTDVDLLMDPAKKFPGIIAPKIEVSTISKIEETVNSNGRLQCDRNTINHKLITSYKIPKKRKFQQRGVCHSSSYRNTMSQTGNKRLPKRPPFVVRHCNEDSLLRKPGFPSKKSSCNLCQTKCSLPLKSSIFASENSRINNLNEAECREGSKRRQKRWNKYVSCNGDENGIVTKINLLCTCNNGHTVKNCHVCHLYARYFNDNLPNGQSKTTLSSKKMKHNKFCTLMKSLNDLKHSSTISLDSCNNQCKNCSTQFCQSKTSLAKKIHERLKKTLNVAKNYSNLRSCNSDSEEDSDKEISYHFNDQCFCSNISENCKKEFLKENVDKLYKRISNTLCSKSNICCT